MPKNPFKKLFKTNSSCADENPLSSNATNSTATSSTPPLLNKQLPQMSKLIAREEVGAKPKPKNIAKKKISEQQKRLRASYSFLSALDEEPTKLNLKEALDEIDPKNLLSIEEQLIAKDPNAIRAAKNFIAQVDADDNIGETENPIMLLNTHGSGKS